MDVVANWCFIRSIPAIVCRQMVTGRVRIARSLTELGPRNHWPVSDTPRPCALFRPVRRSIGAQSRSRETLAYVAWPLLLHVVRILRIGLAVVVGIGAVCAPDSLVALCFSPLDLSPL